MSRWVPAGMVVSPIHRIAWIAVLINIAGLVTPVLVSVTIPVHYAVGVCRQAEEDGLTALLYI